MTTIAQQLEQLEKEMGSFASLGDARVERINQWIDKLSAIRAAVGGEAVAWITDESLRGLARGGNGSRGTVPVHKERSNVAKYPLYASPPAPVDVGASECRWTYDTDTLTDTAWDTECGHRHQFTSDGPAENEHKFCPYCGGKLAALIGKEA